MKRRYMFLVIALFSFMLFLTSCMGPTKDVDFTVKLMDDKIVYQKSGDDKWIPLVSYIDLMLSKSQHVSNLFIGEDEVEVYFQNDDLKWSFVGERKKYVICGKDDIPEELKSISYLTQKKLELNYSYQEWISILKGEAKNKLNYIFVDDSNILTFMIDNELYQFGNYETYQKYIYPDENEKYVVDGITTNISYQKDLYKKINAIEIIVDVKGVTENVGKIYGVIGDSLELPKMDDFNNIKGIVFKGWTDSAGQTYVDSFQFGSVSDNKLIALFDFDLENGGYVNYFADGKLIQQDYYFIGEEVVLPTRANVPGYKLDGWYLDSSLLIPADDIVFEKELNLYAKLKTAKGYELELTDEELKNLTVDIEYWHAMGSNNVSVLREIISNFNEIYPNININLVGYSSYDELRDLIVVKNVYGYDLPQIAQVYPDHVEVYKQFSGVQDLTPYINNSQFGLTKNQLNDYIEVFLDECKSLDGNIYALPFNKSSEVLYFNATWFEKHGLLERYNLGTIEYFDEIGKRAFVQNDNAHLSWEDVEEIAALYKELETGKEYAFASDSPDNLFITLTKQWGGEYISLDEFGIPKIQFNNKESKEAIRWYLQMQNQGLMTIAAKLGVNFTSELMTSNQIIMATGSLAGSSYYENNSYVLGVLPYPQKEDTYKTKENQYVIQQGTNVAVFKNSDPLKELGSWLFIRYLTTWQEGVELSKQPTYIWSINTGYLPITHSLKNNETYLEHLMLSEKMSTIVGMNQHEVMYTTIADVNSNRCREHVEELMYNVLLYEAEIDYAYELALRNILE